MKYFATAAKLSVLLCLGLGSSVALSSDDEATDTILLVSLADGTVIKQVIHVDADICFKQVNSSTTTCLKQGAPIVDAETNTTIGYEMVQNTIELVAKAN